MSQETTDDMAELGNPLAANLASAASTFSPSGPGQPNKTSLATAFAPPVTHVLPDGTTLQFSCIDMDTWAETTAQMVEQRRQKARLKVSANPQLSAQDREWLLLRVDQESITFSRAWEYRTQTPEGIRAGLARQMMKAMGIKANEAMEYVRKIHPIRQRELIIQIADPPMAEDKSEDKGPNAESASTKEIGQSMPPSSDESSQESDLGA